MANKKTPSPRVLAAQWLLDQLDASREANRATLNGIGSRMDTRVSEDKLTKVEQQIDKLAGPLLKRLKNTLRKFHGTDD